MLNTLYIATASGTNPYANLALEEALLNAVLPGECILYLWQNQNTVVIGRNQNSRRECRVEALERDGGFLARRLSGGGAVFHDLGNLNFTFLVHREDYSVPRQLDVILRAVQALGIQAEKSGRNDLTAGGRKFSGNAFYSSGGRCYHHGTILIDVDAEKMSHYLHVSAGKLQFKGVPSVRSRVVNLVELVPGITVETVRQALTAAFGEVYHGTPLPFPTERLAGEELRRLEEKFASPMRFPRDFSGAKLRSNFASPPDRSRKRLSIPTRWMFSMHNVSNKPGRAFLLLAAPCAPRSKPFPWKIKNKRRCLGTSGRFWRNACYEWF